MISISCGESQQEMLQRCNSDVANIVEGDFFNTLIYLKSPSTRWHPYGRVFGQVAHL